MKYNESRERSAEVLRATIALLGQHDAAMNPIAFAVFYEHAAGINARLSEAIAACLPGEPRLGDATVERLYHDHVAGPDEQAVRRTSGELEQVMSGLAERAARTGDQAGEFGLTLGGLETALAGVPANIVDPWLGRAREGTNRMRESASSLREEVAAGQAEIARLRADLVRARDEALLDPLTRTMNRKGFDTRLDAMLEQFSVAGGSHCLVMFDIDRFKGVNDGYGHLMGDRVLQAVSEVLRAAVGDPSHSLARYGGEEFAMLMPATPLAQAFEWAEACRARIKALKIRDRRTHNVILTVTISAGVAAALPADDASGLIARADAALYAAKQAGRDQVRYAAPPPAPR